MRLLFLIALVLLTEYTHLSRHGEAREIDFQKNLNFQSHQLSHLSRHDHQGRLDFQGVKGLKQQKVSQAEYLKA